MLNVRASFCCVLSFWLITAATTSRLHAAVFFVQSVNAKKDLSPSAAAEKRLIVSPADANPWQGDRTKTQASAGVSDVVVSLPSLDRPDLLRNLSSPPATVDNDSSFGSQTLEPKRKSEHVSALSSLGIVASGLEDSPMVTLAMSNEIFERFFRRSYLRPDRDTLRSVLKRGFVGSPGYRNRSRSNSAAR